MRFATLLDRIQLNAKFEQIRTKFTIFTGNVCGNKRRLLIRIMLIKNLWGA